MNKKILLKTLFPITTVAILGGGIASSLTLTSCSNKIEKALEIDVSTPKIINNGTTLNIIGSYKTFNFDSPTIDFASGTSQWFGELSVNYVDKTFATTLSSEAPIEDYVLKLVATKGNDNVFSNEVKFTVGPFAASDGSNWAGHISGTLAMTCDDVTNEAWISGDSSSYVAENLVIPEYVFEDGKFYKVARIGDYAFSGCTNLKGSLTIGRNVKYINSHAFEGCSGLTGSLTIPDSVSSVGEYAFLSCSGLTGSLIIPNSVTSIGGYAFYGCSGFTNITLDGFRSDQTPSWTGTNLFYDWVENGTVSTINGTYNAQDALNFLKLKGLPSRWTVA